MALNITQVCDRCLSERSIDDIMDTNQGGWRELSLGISIPSSLMLCPDCQHDLVHYIRGGKSVMVIIPFEEDGERVWMLPNRQNAVRVTI